MESSTLRRLFLGVVLAAVAIVAVGQVRLEGNNGSRRSGRPPGPNQRTPTIPRTWRTSRDR
ncbi:hypothetical protein ACFQMA_08780 [Halosimplex aquaticum]|uniref:Uncharacterized protein n=1 Tax=Halosimplex aquaticum TaxID=3026162 RepID=A0ABD5XXS5_9EURY|nr:hypothetical protein [Halosimplex aquaticum]